MLRQGIIPLFKLMIDQAVYQITYKCNRRNTQKHAENPCNASAYSDRKDDPEWFQAGGISKNLWPKNQTVKLLQGKNHYDKNDGFYRTDEKQNDRTGNGAYKRAEIRNHICDTYNNTDQHGIGEAQNGHHEKADDSDNG